MFRIDDVTAANALPTPGAAGTPGYFTEGNPGLGIPATKVTGDWLNMVQEEISNVVTGAGLAPDKANFSQLLLAVQTLVGSAVPTGNVAHHFGSTAPTGWVKRHGGTIGDASSGATERANADTLALYTLIWSNTDNSMDGGAFHIQNSSGTSTSRGVSAAADFAAHKRLPLPDDRGRYDRGLNTSGAGIDPSGVLGTSLASSIQEHKHETPIPSGISTSDLYGVKHGTGPWGSASGTNASSWQRTDSNSDYSNVSGGMYTNPAPVLTGAGDTAPASRRYLAVIKL